MLRISLSLPEAPLISFGSTDGLYIDLGLAAVSHSTAPGYSGPYSAVPTRSEQVFATAGMLMDGNFTVDPIPQNYGLITYNGSELTVS